MKLEEYKSLEEKENVFARKTIKTTSEFDTWYDSISKQEGLVFRGMCEAKWKIYTSAQREWITKEYKNNISSYSAYIDKILQRIKQDTLLQRYFKSFNVKANDLLYLCFLQHYSCPTPMLDFTYNKDIALFFATEGIKQCPFRLKKSISNYLSLYYIDFNEGNNKNQIVHIDALLNDLLKKAKELREKYPKADFSLVENIEETVRWHQQQGDGFEKISLCFIPSPEKSEPVETLSNESLYWVNPNIIAQEGCLFLYNNERLPFENMVLKKDTFNITKIHCVDIHKSLVEYIQSKIKKSSDDIYPTFKQRTQQSYNDFKKTLK